MSQRPILSQKTRITKTLLTKAMLLLASCGGTLALLSRRVERARLACLQRIVFQPRPDDLFIVSFPKSGTTVMQMILHHVIGDGSMQFRHIDDKIPWFEHWLVREPAVLERMQSPRVFKSHMAIDQLPRHARCIYLIRNPKDVCVSYFLHLSSLGAWTGSLRAFVNRFVDDKSTRESWFQHVRRSLRFAKEDRMLLVGYDEIVHDLPGVIEKVSRFVARPMSTAQQALAEQQCAFAFMKAHNDKFDPALAIVADRPITTQFIRNGAVGDWVNNLSPDQASTIDKRISKTIGQLNHVLSPPHLEILKGPDSRVSGTLILRLKTGVGNVLLLDTDDGADPWGVQIKSVPASVAAGEVVRLVLSVDPRSESLECLATAEQNNGTSTRLRFEDIDSRKKALLDAFTARSDCATLVAARGAATSN